MSRDASDAVRLSLRLLTTSRLVERRIDQMFRARFASTISRFDFLSALDRHGPLPLGEVSRNLLVSNGNVTGLAQRLRDDGLIEDLAQGEDRRVQRVQLTTKGQALFTKMARAHATCVDELFDDLTQADKRALTSGLDRAKSSIRTRTEREAAQ